MLNLFGELEPGGQKFWMKKLTIVTAHEAATNQRENKEQVDNLQNKANVSSNPLF